MVVDEFRPKSIAAVLAVVPDSPLATHLTYQVDASAVRA